MKQDCEWTTVGARHAAGTGRSACRCSPHARSRDSLLTGGAAMAPDVYGTQSVAGDDHKAPAKQIELAVAVAGKYDPCHSLPASGIVIDPSINAISGTAEHGPMLPDDGACGRLEHEREFRSRLQKGHKLGLRKPFHPRLRRD
jgi:hypothetical protein